MKSRLHLGSEPSLLSSVRRLPYGSTLLPRQIPVTKGVEPVRRNDPTVGTVPAKVAVALVFDRPREININTPILVSVMVRCLRRCPVTCLLPASMI